MDTDKPDEQLPEPAPVKLADDGEELSQEDADALVRGWQGDDADAERLRGALRDRELEHGEPVSENVVGRWAVYDNHELRFVAGGGVHADPDDAERELDELRPTTGHDLVVVEV